MRGKPIANYQNLLTSLKEKILQRRPAGISDRTLLLSLYWEIGEFIRVQTVPEKNSTKLLVALSKDLGATLNNIKGLSPRNLRYMRDFASAYSGNSRQILQGIFLRLSWSHHVCILGKIKEDRVRLFYIHKAAENGWSRAVMMQQIESGLYEREGRLLTNFNNTISPKQSDSVQRIFKDPYTFDFIQLGPKAKEREIEIALTGRMKEFLVELGQGFAYVGRQHKVFLGEKEYFYDLLFYHTRLKSYIVIDVKRGEFKPDYLGKMNFYLTLADEYIKAPTDEKSIGLLLCRSKDGLVADYALRDSSKPIGIAEYRI